MRNTFSWKPGWPVTRATLLNGRMLPIFRLVVAVMISWASFGGRASADTPQNAGDESHASVELQQIAHEYAALYRESEARDTLPDRSASVIAARYANSERLRQRLKALDAAALSDSDVIAHAILVDNLDSLEGLRVCRSELWDINHVTGWQIRFPPQIAAQRIATSEDRERALRLWSTLPDYISTDIENLRTGVTNGYTVPRTVVNRVLRQLDALLSASSEESPLLQPAIRASDPQFQAQWRSLASEKIVPAIRRFDEFLRSDYLPRARDTIGISALPDGVRCYAAFLKRATTLDRSPRATFALGQATVMRSRTELRTIGRRMFGTDDIQKILEHAKASPENRFHSPDELLSYSNAMLRRSKAMSSEYFFNLPQQEIEISPLPEYQRGSGISSHYEGAASSAGPAFYRIDLDDWADETRGAAAVTVVHETVPGHHLQTAIARTVKMRVDVTEIAFNSAYVEGWANYVERFCEEAGFYDNPYAKIFRRSVLGESLMIDPAIHIMGWDRKRARAELEAIGETVEEADEIIDRIAVQPAQLTSYETGGLEIFALRETAKRALGRRFDIREFHQQVLQNGDVPLRVLDHQIRAWVNKRRAYTNVTATR